MDFDLNMPFFVEEDLSSDAESQVSPLIENNITPLVSENTPQGTNISDATENNDPHHAVPLTAAVEEVSAARYMFFTSSYRARRNQAFPPGAGRRRYKRRGGARPSSPLRFCTYLHCMTRTTPMWRSGPMGPKTLCNACGIYYNKHRVRRDVPAASTSGSVPPPGTMGGDSSTS